MYIKYADRKKICEKLAAYRVGEIVAVLTDTECEDGLIEAQTKLTITSIKIRDNIFVPEILENQLSNYVSDCDEYNFIYTLTPIDSTPAGIYDFSSSEFVRADEFVGKDFNSIYRAKEKRRKRAAAKYWGKVVLLLAAGFISYTAIISLLLLPIFWICEIPFFTAPFLALGIAFFAMLFSMLSEKITGSFTKLTTNHCIAKRKDR